MTVAIYPGTFDPVHFGHIDVARRAADLFDEVVVGVYDHPNKHLLFDVEERVALARQALADDDRITVASYSGLTVQFARRHGAKVIVRGLRAISDFEMEYQMALTNRKLAPELDMVCLMTSQEYAFISSTIVKDIAKAGGEVTEFVPEHVQEALRVRFRHGE